MNKPPKAFITYSHKNEKEREKLEKLLHVIAANKEIDIRDDNKILPGDAWEKEIKGLLEQSDILLYLVSSASLASLNCNRELIEALSKEEIKVIPIILETCDFQSQAILSRWQALPVRNGRIKPISDWNPRSKGWQNVADGIRKVLKSLDDTPPGLATLFAALGKHQDATREYSEAIKLNPNDALLYNDRGNAYRRKGDLDRAIEDYGKAIELNPNDALLYNNRGNAYCEKRDFDHAIEDYNRAVKLDPSDALLYNDRGNAYYDKKKFDLAIEDHNKAIELDPDYALLYNDRGKAYSKKHDFDRAIDDYNKAIKLDPNYALAYHNRGNAYRDKGHFAKADADFSEAERLFKIKDGNKLK